MRDSDYWALVARNASYVQISPVTLSPCPVYVPYQLLSILKRIADKYCCWVYPGNKGDKYCCWVPVTKVTNTAAGSQ